MIGQQGGKEAVDDAVTAILASIHKANLSIHRSGAFLLLCLLPDSILIHPASLCDGNSSVCATCLHITIHMTAKTTDIWGRAGFSNSRKYDARNSVVS